jgi:DHA1 family bicyclomycin/chloramphenicol resistance-like MFS transporter
MTITTQRLGSRHFTALISMMMALTAIAIDLMLPAFDDIRAYFGLPQDATQVAQIVTTFFLGMALAQYVYGPLADRFGRKPVLYAGLGIYALGALGAMLAPSLGLVLVCRFIWGVGAAGPRVVTTSIVRDYYSGDQMARAMSYIMAVFIMVPVVAPTIGAGLISIFPWQSVFAFCLVFAAIVGTWAALVLPETLAPADRRSIDRQAIWATTREVLTNRITIGYTIAMTATFSVFISYLASSELIFGDFYGKAEQFPLIFGGIAVVMGIAMLANAQLVERVGTRRLTHVIAVGYVVASGVITTVTLAAGGRLSFWPFVACLAVLIVFHALLMPNLNTIAMLPMGHIAGTASAVIGTVSMSGGALFGSIINGMYTDSALPLIVAFLAFGVLTLAAVIWAERGRLIVAPAAGATSLET